MRLVRREGQGKPFRGANFSGTNGGGVSSLQLLWSSRDCPVGRDRGSAIWVSVAHCLTNAPTLSSMPNWFQKLRKRGYYCRNRPTTSFCLICDYFIHTLIVPLAVTLLSHLFLLCSSACVIWLVRVSALESSYSFMIFARLITASGNRTCMYSQLN